MNLQVVVAFGVYFSILGVIGFLAYWKSRKSNDFILGKRSINYWVTAISVQASDMSDWLFMGFPALVLTRGLPEAWTAIGLVGGMFLTWQYVAHKLRIETEKYGSRTLSSYFESRFGDTSGMIRLISAIFCLIFFTFYISSNLVGLGRLFESLLGISYHIGISIGVVIVFYTLFGGFVSMAWVDFFQGLFLLTMLLLVPVIALIKLGGIGAVSTAAALKNISLEFVPSFSLTTLKDILFTSLSWGLGYFGMPHVLTKFMGIDDASKMKRAQYIGLTWQILALSGAVIVGLVGIAYFPEGLARPELVFVNMVQDLFSPFFAGFILCSVLAATINLIGAQVLVSASIITEDFFKRWVGSTYSDQKMIWLSRASVIVLCILAYIAASTTTQSIYNLVKYAWSGLGCTFGPVLLLALHSKITDRNVALAGIITGGVTGVLWQHVDTTIPSMIAGYAMSFAAMAIVAAASKSRSLGK